MVQRAKNVYHLLVAILANTIHGFPARKLTVIGVTGTDGKTTTSSLIYHILKTAGKDVSLISTVGAYIRDKTFDTGFHVTNPASLALQKFIRYIVKNEGLQKQRYLVLEVTSHGIDQNRIWGIPFSIAVLTNITHEHLDYHKTYDNYIRTKVRLLQRAKIAILNKDDPSYPLVRSQITNPTSRIITYGLKDAEVNAKNSAYKSKYAGSFNHHNELAAIAVCKELGIPEDIVKKSLDSFILPVGRLEVVYKKDFTIMIDFAHTPNAFEQLLSSIKSKGKGRLIHVFGSAGERDRSKRPEMGEVAGKYDDVIFLTSEDPRSETVEKINAQIKQGIDSGSSTRMTIEEIPDRQEAINAAVKMAKKGDFVVITGKAHEMSMNYGKGEQPWSDFSAVEIALKNKQIIQNK